MTMIEQNVARHYTHGSLETAILSNLEAMGRSPDDVRPEDLAGIDEFHLGGHQATAELAEQLDLQPEVRLSRSRVPQAHLRRGSEPTPNPRNCPMRMVLPTTVAVVLSVTLGAAGGHAQDDYPSRPITMVVPFSAGGPTDTVARLIAEPMSRVLGQQIVIENVTGAGGTLGAAHVAAVEPDGYTLLLHHIGMATSATLYRNLDYDPLTDFAFIGLVTEVPMTIVARSDFPADDLAELIDYVRANAGTVTYANSGIGSAAHLCGMLFMDAIDTQLTTVPYAGSGPALMDVVAGVVDLICDQTTNTTGQIQGGNVKAFAITTAERLEMLPDVPTTAEAGLGDLRIGVWHGLYAAAGTPELITAELSQALQAALADEHVVARFAELGTTPVPVDHVTPKALEQHLISQIEQWRPIIEAAGAYAD